MTPPTPKSFQDPTSLVAQPLPESTACMKQSMHKNWTWKEDNIAKWFASVGSVISAYVTMSASLMESTCKHTICLWITNSDVKITWASNELVVHPSIAISTSCGECTNFAADMYICCNLNRSLTKQYHILFIPPCWRSHLLQQQSVAEGGHLSTKQTYTDMYNAHTWRRVSSNHAGGAEQLWVSVLQGKRRLWIVFWWYSTISKNILHLLALSMTSNDRCEEILNNKLRKARTLVCENIWM